MSGRYVFGIPSNSAHALVSNQGEITIADGGLLAFVAPGIENTGVIRARLGKVSLASGNTFTLDLYGDGLVQIAVDSTTVTESPNDGVAPAFINQQGKIFADGGVVELTVKQARGLVDTVINMS